MNIFGRIITFLRDLKTFRSTIKEWLGEGGVPVAASIAEARAEMCFLCPFNKESGFVMEKSSDALKRVLEAKRRMRLSASGESKLHVCELCRCYLPTKIHVPIKFIRQYQREDVRQSIKHGKPECWQLRSGD